MELPDDIQSACAPLFDVLSLDSAMPALVPTDPASDEVLAVLHKVLANPAIASRPALKAGLWLYVDALDDSHSISQGLPDATGSFWHGIMHRREGDFPNAHYWFDRTGRHPAMGDISGYDPHAYVDAVAESHRSNPEDLVALQRAEWAALFAWCAGR